MLSGKEIVLGVTGGIAAYKACEIVRALRKEGAGVRVILTASGARFITPLTLQTLSKNPVYTDLFDLVTESDIGHISLAQRANLLMIAPATANILGKIRGGISDDLLSTVVMATAAPVLLAPAMNSQMYASPAVRENVEILRGRGFTFVDPDEGELACGTVGPGRLADTGKIVEMARILLAEKILAGKRVVVGAGPTAEDIDPVRFLTNRSSGKMGFALAEEAIRRGAHVTIVAGPTRVEPPAGGAIVRVRTAAEMREAVLRHGAMADVVIMAAAVADYTPAQGAAATKLSRESETLELRLTKTADILAELGQARGAQPGPVLVGFAAESGAPEVRARQKLTAKGADLIVANDISRRDAGFDVDLNAVTLIGHGWEQPLPLQPKRDVARAILDRVDALLQARAPIALPAK